MEYKEMYYAYRYNTTGDILPVETIVRNDLIIDYLYENKKMYPKVVITDLKERNFSESENGWIIYPMKLALQDIKDHIVINPFSPEEFKLALLRLNIVISSFNNSIDITDAKLLIENIEILYGD